jgi:hypothetical protein
MKRRVGRGVAVGRPPRDETKAPIDEKKIAARATSRRTANAELW